MKMLVDVKFFNDRIKKKQLIKCNQIINRQQIILFRKFLIRIMFVFPIFHN